MSKKNNEQPQIENFTEGRNRYTNFINGIQQENIENNDSVQYQPVQQNFPSNIDYSQQNIYIQNEPYQQYQNTQQEKSENYLKEQPQIYIPQNQEMPIQEYYQQANYQQNNYQQDNYQQDNYTQQPKYNSSQQNYQQQLFSQSETVENVIEATKQKEKMKELHTEYPSMGLRFKAAFFDFVLSTTIAIILFFNFLYETIMNTYNLYASTGGKTILDLILNLKGKIISYIIFLLFINLILNFLIPVLLKGQTIGKKICKIRIVSDFIDETDIPTPKQIFKREILGKAVGFLTLGLCFIPSKKKEFNKAFPDSIADTHIVYGNANQ